MENFQGYEPVIMCNKEHSKWFKGHGMVWILKCLLQVEIASGNASMVLAGRAQFL